ncbi:hypothetical protein B9Z55_024894 [Caenorhabditis nigoni]|uniref:F-box domain-containing protein n=1 Tax=Caenorhabditis nigoni TaxID=1611254 RepID=A0A2G5SVZ4_9PELO|nr:hypothetical protein B9Z55_024894 [Caenorhabditis nigoni]
MKLTRYPYLVQREILQNIDYQNLFLLSFASLKMKQLIKSTQNDRFKNISSIRYTCDRNRRPIVDILFKNGRKEDLLAITKRQKTGYYYFKPEIEFFQINVSGKLIDFTSSNIYVNYIRGYNGHIVATFNRDESTAVIESIHNYILNFFGDSVEYYWKTTDYGINIPHLQNVTACMRMWYINGGTANLDNFFSATPDLKSISIKSSTKKQLVRSDSKFYQAECIDTVQEYIDFPAVLLHFQGKQVFITCKRCEMFHLINFVKRWKSGKAFQKLEQLSFKVFGGISKDKVLKAIGAKHIDATKTPPTHTVPTKVEWYDEENVDELTKAGPITSHRYVVRKADKHVASVLIQEKTFRFGVWDMTEGEFLGMME